MNIGIDILHNLDMNRYQILNLVLQNLGTAPTGTIPEGFIYYNTAQKRTLQWNGTSWISVGGDYVLPVASTSALGGIKVNSSNATITVNQSTGVLDVLNNMHSHTSANITDATSANTANMIVKRDASGNFVAGTITAALTGNASSATKWQTARTITFTGAAYGASSAFDGTGNISVSLTNQSSGVTAGTYKSVTVNAGGIVTAGSNPTTLSGYGITDAAPSSHVGATGAAHGVATTSVAGFLSATDKVKLNASLTAIPVATSSVLGGIKSGTDITVDGDGNVSVVDNSHTHTIANVTSLQSTLDAKIAATSISQDVATDYTSTSKVPSTKATYDFVNTKVAGLFQFKGSIQFSSRPTPSASNVGWTYNIQNPFTTDATFIEGAGKSYPSGTNIVVINSNGYKWDVLAGTVDLSSYYTKNAFERVLKGAIFTLAAGQTSATFHCPGVITSVALYNATTGNMLFTKLLYGHSGTSVTVVIATAQTFNITVATSYIAFGSGGVIPCQSCDSCESGDCGACENCESGDCGACENCQSGDSCGDGWQEECGQCPQNY